MSGGVTCLVSINTGWRSWAVMTGIGLALPRACMKLVRAWKMAAMLPAASRPALQSWLAEENCRVFTASLPEEYQPGAPGRRGAAGATAAAADLPAWEAQQQQQQQQQCGRAREISTDGAPITPTGQAAALPQRHGSSNQEQEQWDAAGERCLHLHQPQ